MVCGARGSGNETSIGLLEVVPFVTLEAMVSWYDSQGTVVSGYDVGMPPACDDDAVRQEGAAGIGSDLRPA